MKILGSKAYKEISFDSLQLVYVIIGLMTSGFLITYITIACLLRGKKQWVRISGLHLSSTDLVTTENEFDSYSHKKTKRKIAFMFYSLGG